MIQYGCPSCGEEVNGDLCENCGYRCDMDDEE